MEDLPSHQNLVWLEGWQPPFLMAHLLLLQLSGLCNQHHSYETLSFQASVHIKSNPEAVLSPVPCAFIDTTHHQPVYPKGYRIPQLCTDISSPLITGSLHCICLLGAHYRIPEKQYLCIKLNKPAALSSSNSPDILNILHHLPCESQPTCSMPQKRHPTTDSSIANRSAAVSIIVNQPSRFT